MFKGWVLVEWEGEFPSWQLMVALLAHTRHQTSQFCSLLGQGQ